MRALLLAALAVVLPSIAYAAEPKVDCKDPQSNYEMKMCAGEELRQADGELNLAFERAVKAADEQYAIAQQTPGIETMPNMPAELRKTQRMWEAFRDANCAYQNLIYYGGSMASLAVTSCRRDMTRARVKELNEFVEPQ